MMKTSILEAIPRAGACVSLCLFLVQASLAQQGRDDFPDTTNNSHTHNYSETAQGTDDHKEYTVAVEEIDKEEDPDDESSAKSRSAPTRTTEDADPVELSDVEPSGQPVYVKQYYDQANTKLKSEGKTLGDVRHGDWVFYHENGNKSSEGEYRSGKKHDHWIYWNESGLVLRIENYREGELIDTVSVGKE